VEDEEDNREMLTAMLESHGIVVTAVDSADAALA
jgi:CheY-like chemotaxis protein